MCTDAETATNVELSSLLVFQPVPGEGGGGGYLCNEVQVNKFEHVKASSE